MAIYLIEITLIILLMVYLNNAEIDIFDDSKQCISYRYLPCTNRVIPSTTTISKDETLIEYNVSSCILYQFIPCRDGWENFTLVYNNGTRPANQSTSCQNETAMAAVLQSKSYCETNLTKCLEKKEVLTIEMKKMENDFEYRYHRVIREKKFLSDYMVSVWDTRAIEEMAEKAKVIRDRMQDYIRYSVGRLALIELTNVPKLQPDFGTVYNDVLTFQYPLNIPACPKNGTTTTSLPSLFVAVNGVAADNNQKRRDEIRLILQNEIKALQQNLFSSINFAFFLGKPDDAANQSLIEQESARNKDVVQVDMIDTGKNGSLKLAAILNWVRLYCFKVDVIFKIDENFEKITLKKLGSTLPERDIPDTFVYGVMGDTVPYRGEGRKQTTMEEFPWTNYPANVNVLAYFITSNMIIPLMAAFQTVPMIPLEEAYLGICIIKADLKTYTYCGRDINFSSCF